MAQLIDGKAISQQIKDELKAEVEALKNDGTDICLAVIQVGDDPASSVYVRNKKRACDRITDFVKYTDLSNRRIHRWLRKRTAYAGMRSCLCASDPGTGTVVSSFFKHVSTFWGTPSY